MVTAYTPVGGAQGRAMGVTLTRSAGDVTVITVDGVALVSTVRGQYRITTLHDDVRGITYAAEGVSDPTLVTHGSMTSLYRDAPTTYRVLTAAMHALVTAEAARVVCIGCDATVPVVSRQGHCPRCAESLSPSARLLSLMGDGK